MSRVLLAIVLLAFTAQPAFAIPGQTEKQIATWGKTVSAFHGFKPTMDDETGGTNYMATLTVDGFSADFSSEPSKVVHQEYVSFQNVADSWTIDKHPQLIKDTLRAVYGSAIESDFENATKVPLHGQVVAWTGKKLAYATLGAALFIVNNADWPQVLKNIHHCDAIDCED